MHEHGEDEQEEFDYGEEHLINNQESVDSKPLLMLSNRRKKGLNKRGLKNVSQETFKAQFFGEKINNLQRIKTKPFILENDDRS